MVCEKLKNLQRYGMSLNLKYLPFDIITFLSLHLSQNHCQYVHESNIEIYLRVYLFYNASVHLYIYNASVWQTMKHTEPSHLLKSPQAKTSINFNSRVLHFYYVDKFGINVVCTIYAPRNMIQWGALIWRQT